MAVFLCVNMCSFPREAPSSGPLAPAIVTQRLQSHECGFTTNPSHSQKERFNVHGSKRAPRLWSACKVFVAVFRASRGCSGLGSRWPEPRQPQYSRLRAVGREDVDMATTPHFLLLLANRRLSVFLARSRGNDPPKMGLHALNS